LTFIYSTSGELSTYCTTINSHRWEKEGAKPQGPESFSKPQYHWLLNIGTDDRTFTKTSASINLSSVYTLS